MRPRAAAAKRLSHVRPKRLSRSRAKRLALALVCAVAVPLAALAWQRAARPRAWAAGDVPVAFWCWRDELPAPEEVRRAAREAGARVLFVRAGQLHAEGARVVRVRAPRGRFPDSLPVHLVYNATRTLLASFAGLDSSALRSAVVETFAEDSRRAALDGARVAGLQIDLDVPTRLLPLYASLLRDLRGRLAPGTRLSVTGLPTWMDSPALAAVLAEVDFWIPQFYGSRIPARLSEPVPISSTASVAAGVERARRLGRPFYAGLAAYGYAALYTQRGALAELRGDIDPQRVAADPSFELIERRAYDPSPLAEVPDINSRAASDAAPTRLHESAEAHVAEGAKTSNLESAETRDAEDAKTADAEDREMLEAEGAETGMTGDAYASHWRYVFRARADTSVAGLRVRAGEHLMFDAPSAESLRASARAVRERGGARLVGLCLFRLPVRSDATTLTLSQIAAALADEPAAPNTRVSLRAGESSSATLTLTAENAGAGGALAGEALSLTLGVPPGSVRGVLSLEGFTNVETLCGDVAARAETPAAPCGARRANLLRFTAPAWQPGARARALLSVGGTLPRRLHVHTRVRDDDGRTRKTSARLLVGRDASRGTRAAGGDGGSVRSPDDGSEGERR